MLGQVLSRPLHINKLQKAIVMTRKDIYLATQTYWFRQLQKLPIKLIAQSKMENYDSFGGFERYIIQSYVLVMMGVLQVPF